MYSVFAIFMCIFFLSPTGMEVSLRLLTVFKTNQNKTTASMVPRTMLGMQ